MPQYAVKTRKSHHLSCIRTGNGSLYGVHPVYWYFLAGLPAIAGVLLPFYLFDAYRVCFTKEGNNRSRSVRRLLHFLIAMYIMIHSISAHKEFRFIMPVLPLVCVLSGHEMSSFVLEKKDSNGAGIKYGIFNGSAGKRTYFLAILLILANYPHLWFLTTVHQRAPISVNKAMVGMISQSSLSEMNTKATEDMPEYNIHYLLGCHSTPVFSHLHTQGAKTNVWTLDCSPSCRSNNSIRCESDEFLSEPKSFFERSYESAEGGFQCSSQDECATKEEANILRRVPDLLVTYDSTASEIGKQLRDHGMIEIMRIPNTVKSISLRPKGLQKNNGTTIFNLVYFQFHQFVIFAEEKRFRI